MAKGKSKHKALKIICILAALLAAIYIAAALVLKVWNPVEMYTEIKAQIEATATTDKSDPPDANEPNDPTEPSKPTTPTDPTTPTPPEQGGSTEPNEELSDTAKQFISKVNLLLSTPEIQIYEIDNEISEALSKLTDKDMSTAHIETTLDVYRGFMAYYAKSVLTDEVRNEYIQRMVNAGLRG